MTKAQQWLGEVEGLRGLASMWVFAFHAALLCGASIPIISAGDRGVDLFILISGFIMVHQFHQRESVEPWQEASTRTRFWVRRFFRIAPLYYPLLLVSLAFHQVTDGARAVIVSHYPVPVRLHDPTLVNFLAHFTFAFGLLPHFASRTPLPDWSIGLEIQFYFVFPFLMMLTLRLGYRKMASIVSVVSFLIILMLPVYFHGFAMPASLPLRLYLFIMGMLIGAKMHSAAGQIWPLLIALPVLAHFVVPEVNFKTVIAQVVLAVFFLLVTQKEIGRWRALIDPARKLLRYRPVQQVGLFSYSIYLVHLLVVFPMGAFMLQRAWFVKSVPVVRFLTLFIASACIVIPLSWLLYTFIERPGVRLGKLVLSNLMPGVQKSLTVIPHTQSPEQVDSTGVSAP